MARSDRGRVGFGRMFSPRRRRASAVASQASQQKRRERRARRWRERFKRFSLSARHVNAIVQTVCGLFRSSAETARTLRAATTSQMVGVGFRQLRGEGLEERQMLSTTPWVLGTQGDFSQDWSNTALIAHSDSWTDVPSVTGYLGDMAIGTGVDPTTILTPHATLDAIPNQTAVTLTTGGVAEFDNALLYDDFDGYLAQANFESAWPAIGTTSDTAKKSAQLSSVQSASPSNSIFVPVSTTATAALTEYRNRRTFTESGAISTSQQVVWSYDFYDAIGGNPQRNYANLQDTTAPTATNQLVSMGLNSNQFAIDSGGNFYMARILGYTSTAVDPDGGPNESAGGVGTAVYFKLNDFGAGLRSVGWHNLKVIISTNDGTSTDYEFYVDNVLAERVSDVGTAASLRSYDNVVIGSGLTNGTASAYFDNVSVFAVPNGNPTVALQGSGNADAPSLNLFMNSAGRENVTIDYDLGDIDTTADNAIQPVALQYRTSNASNFNNVSFVADASDGPSLTKTTHVTASMPEWNNQSYLEFRILTTNAVGNDEWIGIDNIVVTSIPVIPPVFTSSATTSVPENTTSVVTLAATDASVPAQLITFTITGGDDDGLFTITGGNQLEFSPAPDFEVPGDFDGDNVYLVQVTADDNNGGTAQQLITITVTDVNDNPAFTSSAAPSVIENTTAVVTLSATDDDVPAQLITFTITGGDDDGLFTITGGNQLEFSPAPDFEVPGDFDGDNVYLVQVTADDNNGGTTIQSISVTVTPANDNNPVFTSAASTSVAENNTTVLTLSATDDDVPAQLITFTITGGDDDGLFTITGGNQLEFSTAPDFEVPGDFDGDNVYLVQVTADDNNGGTTIQSISVTVTPANDNNPVFTSAASTSVAENNTTVLTLSATDADVPAQLITFTITGGDDDGLFTITGGNQLEFSPAPDFEVPGDFDGDNVYLVQVTADDNNGGTAQQLITITVTDVNDNPAFTSSAAPSVIENTTAVVTLSATDDDVPAQLITFTITGGDDDGLFTITGGNQLEFSPAPDFEVPGDFDGDNVYLVQVTADDNNGGTTIQSISVTVTPLNDHSPVANNDGNDVTEDSVLVASGNVITNDTDDDLPAETLTIDGLYTGTGIAGTYGSLDLAADGSYTYTLNNAAVQSLAALQTVSDLFNYQITDGTNSSNVAVLTVTIHGANDPALIGGDTSGDVTEDSGGDEIDSGTLMVSDTDSGESAFQPSGSATVYGSYTLDEAGNWTYTLDNANGLVQILDTGETLTDTFTATSIDGTTQLVSITINGVDDPPLADYNDDFNIDAADYVVWRKFQNTTVLPYKLGDGTGDGQVDGDDYGLWVENYGEAASGGGGSDANLEFAASSVTSSLVTAVHADTSSVTTQGAAEVKGATQDARDEALEGLASLSASRATARPMRSATIRPRSVHAAPAKIDAFLLDLAMEAKRERVSEQNAPSCDVYNQDKVDLVDDLFAELESKKFAGVAL